MGVINWVRNIFKRSVDDVRRISRRIFDVPSPVLSIGNDPLSIGTVYRCVNVVADSVAILPIQCLRRSGDIYVEDTESDLNYLLNVQPNERMNAVDFWQMVVRYLLLKGNAYIYPETNRKGVYTRLLLLTGSVSYNVIEHTYYVQDSKAGLSGAFSEDEIIHLKNYSVDGITGISTISYAAGVLATARTADDETLNRFANGGSVRGIVSNDRATSTAGYGEHQDEQLEGTAEDLDEKLNQNGQRIVSVPGQVAFTQLAMSSADMQFLETRKFTVKDICRFFGVPGTFVYDDTSNNYKSAEMANVAFLSTTLNPLLRKIETELLRKFVSKDGSALYRFRFDRSELYATDLEGKSKYQSSLIQNGVCTVNELRRMENRPAVDGGDTPLVSANLKAISEFGVPGFGNRNR